MQEGTFKAITTVKAGSGPGARCNVLGRQLAIKQPTAGACVYIFIIGCG